MKALAAWIIPAATVCVLAGCMTTPDTVTPVTTQIAQLRSQVRRLDDKTDALQQGIDDVNAKINDVERETANMQNVIRQDQNTIRESLQNINNTRKQDIKTVTESLTRSNAQELERMNTTLAKVVDTVEKENQTIRKQVAGDLVSLQNDIKALQVQLNAYMDKTDRLEKMLRDVSTVSSSTSSSQKTGTKRTSEKPAIKRTGTPSSPDIDYVNVYKHTVVSGETLWKIARDYNVTVQDILNVNEDINDMTILTIGQTIYVPSHKSDQ
jgi:LysM repeat protein/outer membrane murein-binding lipoprotein Lpp